MTWVRNQGSKPGWKGQLSVWWKDDCDFGISEAAGPFERAQWDKMDFRTGNPRPPIWIAGYRLHD